MKGNNKEVRERTMGENRKSNENSPVANSSDIQDLLDTHYVISEVIIQEL
jgi:hypothetical protein